MFGSHDWDLDRLQVISSDFISVAVSSNYMSRSSYLIYPVVWLTVGAPL